MLFELLGRTKSSRPPGKRQRDHGSAQRSAGPERTTPPRPQGQLTRLGDRARERLSRRPRRSPPGNLRAQPQLLQGQSVEFAGGSKPMGGLKALHRFHGRSIPFPAGLTWITTVAPECGLYFPDALGRGGLLAAFTTARSATLVRGFLRANSRLALRAGWSLGVARGRLTTGSKGGSRPLDSRKKRGGAQQNSRPKDEQHSFRAHPFVRSPLLWLGRLTSLLLDRHDACQEDRQCSLAIGSAKHF